MSKSPAEMPKTAPARPDVGALSFEEALKELETIVGQLEQGQVNLEDAITFYERGAALKGRCEALLRQADERVQKITLDANKRPAGLTPLDAEG